MQYHTGVNVLKVKDIGTDNHYFIRGYYFQYFFTCYYYVSFIINFGLIKKILALLIIPNCLLLHTL